MKIYGLKIKRELVEKMVIDCYYNADDELIEAIKNLDDNELRTELIDCVLDMIGYDATKKEIKKELKLWFEDEEFDLVNMKPKLLSDREKAIKKLEGEIIKKEAELRKLLWEEQKWNESYEAKNKDLEWDDVSDYEVKANKMKGERVAVDALINSLNEKPLMNHLKIAKFNNEQRERLGPKLKEWYENTIRKRMSNEKFLVHLIVKGEEKRIPIDRIETRLYNMFSGDYCFKVEQLAFNVNSGDDTPLYISMVEDLWFEKVVDYKMKKNERKKEKDGAFFPYRLKEEYKEFEVFTQDIQIFRELPKVQHSCFINSLRAFDVPVNVCEMINNDLMGRKHIRTLELTTIANKYSLAIRVRMWYEQAGQVVYLNKENSGWFGNKKKAIHEVELDLVENHFMPRIQLPISSYAVQHWNEIKDSKYYQKHGFEKCFSICNTFKNNNYQSKPAQAHMWPINFVMLMKQMNAFEPIYCGDVDFIKSGINDVWIPKEKMEIVPEKYGTFQYKVMKDEKKFVQEPIDLHNVFYGDFETCSKVDDETGKKQEVAFMLCVQDYYDEWKHSYVGFDCAEKFVKEIPDKSIVYFHNLGFDGRLLMKCGVSTAILKGSKIIKETLRVDGKVIYLKDSYSMFPQALRTFPAAFKKEFEGTNIKKELFPYRYYSYERVEKAVEALYKRKEENKYYGIIDEVGEDDGWNDEEKKVFIQNVKDINAGDDEKFNMIKYCEFYCQQDVNVLRVGYNAFRNAALKDPINLDIFQFTTAPALANAWLNREVFYQNGNLYSLSGNLRDYIMGAIYGGRCMTRDNKRYHVEGKFDDFDACSLYPSAMARLFTVEGLPGVLNIKNKDKIYTPSDLPEFMKHSFTEDQTEITQMYEEEGTIERFISYYICDIEIVKVNKSRHFPLIVKRENGIQSNVNECVKMRVDQIMLEDLVRFQQIEFKVLNGYVWQTKRDLKIRESIRLLFDKRAEYKKEGNSCQQVLKLIMNSGYGKSIQKPIEKETRYVKEDKYLKYINEHYHNIYEIRPIPEADIYAIDVTKNQLNQFNNPVFGVSVLSMSKRIMNEVICLAEDLDINIYYQDTDSIHVEHDKIELLDSEFKNLYNRPLIGENTIGCFHSDFDEIKEGYCVEHISAGKKIYYDKLYDSKLNKWTEHFRLKGIPQEVIVNFANDYYNGDVRKIYEYLYEGATLTFDLLDDGRKVRFVMEKNGMILHKNEFKRRVKATCPKADA